MNNYRTIVLLRMFCLLMITSGVISPKVLLAQTKRIDSLLILIKPEKADTNQVKLLLALAAEYKNNGLTEKEFLTSDKAYLLSKKNIVEGQTVWGKGIILSCLIKGDIKLLQNDYDNASLFYNEALKYANIVNDKQHQAQLYNKLGTIDYLKSLYDDAYDKFKHSLQIASGINAKESVAKAYNSIGNICYMQGDYSKALDNYLLTLSISAEIKDKVLETNSYINIGNIYQLQKDPARAIEYYNKALKMKMELNDREGITNIYSNIGYSYYSDKKYTEALKSYFNAQQIAEKTNNQYTLATTCLNMANVYSDLGQHSAALDNFKIALDIYKKLGNKYEEGITLVNLSTIYLETGKNKEGHALIQEALRIGNAIGSKAILKESYFVESKIDSVIGDWKSAYQSQRAYLLYKDSIAAEENMRQTLQSTMTFEFHLKEAEAKALQDKKDAIVASEKKQQQIILLLVSCLLILALLLSVFIFRSLKNARKQKLLIEEKNKDIIDSINYAKRIQDALLRNETQAGELLPEHFIFNCPKDIVSGDFYWSIQKNDYWYFAVADCTGHGVPGGFMSMLGIAFLNEITAHIELPTPAQILNLLRDKIVEELQQNENNINKDGMDISLIRYHIKTRALQWAGANNALYIISKDGFQELKPNKQPIGFYIEMSPFTNHELKLKKEDMLYLFTDGYSDQFGGEKGRKFLSKQLKELLNSIAALPLAEQKQVLATTFDNWKNGFEQVDDVCIAGILI